MNKRIMLVIALCLASFATYKIFYESIFGIQKSPAQAQQDIEKIVLQIVHDTNFQNKNNAIYINSHISDALWQSFDKFNLDMYQECALYLNQKNIENKWVNLGFKFDDSFYKNMIKKAHFNLKRHDLGLFKKDGTLQDNAFDNVQSFLTTMAEQKILLVTKKEDLL
ncbi:hypothetical protein KBC04_00370 [Candidatus Babeliales bacterium]|nr:hypothetical protein [Candidatus Babeliales bacterium]MBP9843454.1 hypothetical protein [Candidatus Babeliales bacterium]